MKRIEDWKLTEKVKLTDYGAASPQNGILSKEDERSAELARRAQKGDYDDGSHPSFSPPTRQSPY